MPTSISQKRFLNFKRNAVENEILSKKISIDLKILMDISVR